MSTPAKIEIVSPVTRLIQIEGEEPISLSIVQPVTRLMSLAVQGPQGPPGPPGTGTGGSAPWQEAVFVLASNQTVFVLPTTPAVGSVSFFTNGLRETNSNFVVTGTTLTVTGFVPGAGDTVHIIYQ